MFKFSKKIKTTKKHPVFLLMGLSLFLLLPSCSSMDVEAVKSMDKVAVAMVGVDKYIDMGDYSGLGSSIQRLSDDKSFDLNSIAAELHKKTFNDYKEFMPFDLISEEKVLGASAYQNYTALDNKEHDARLKKYSHVITPEGYLDYSPTFLNKKHIAKLIKTMPEEADGMMLVYLKYTMMKHNVPMVPFSKATIKAEVYLGLYDREGTQVMKVNKKAESDTEMKVVAGIMLKTDEILPMCEEATQKVFDVVDQYIKNELKF